MVGGSRYFARVCGLHNHITIAKHNMRTSTSEQATSRMCKEPCTHPMYALTASMVITTQNIEQQYATPPTETTTHHLNEPMYQVRKHFIPIPSCAITLHQPKHIHVLIGYKRHPMPNICPTYFPKYCCTHIIRITCPIYFQACLHEHLPNNTLSVPADIDISFVHTNRR